MAERDYNLPELGMSQRDWLDALKRVMGEQEIYNALTVNPRKKRITYAPSNAFSIQATPENIGVNGQAGGITYDGKYVFDGNAFELGAKRPIRNGEIGVRYNRNPDSNALRLQYQRSF